MAVTVSGLREEFRLTPRSMSGWLLRLTREPIPVSIVTVRILLIGSAGQKRAPVWKLSQSPHARVEWHAAGNAVFTRERLAKRGSLTGRANIWEADLPGLLALAQEKKEERSVWPDNPRSGTVQV
jgi:hypothetical protein